MSAVVEAPAKKSTVGNYRHAYLCQALLRALQVGAPLIWPQPDEESLAVTSVQMKNGTGLDTDADKVYMRHV